MSALVAESPRWVPGLHDPTVVAWVLVAGYLAVAIGSLRAGRGAREVSRIDALGWYSLAAILLVLSINKELDLHAWAFDVLSDLAQAQGWYEQRWIVASWGLLGLSGLVFLVGFGLIRSVGIRSKALRLAMIATVLLVLTLIAQSISANPLGSLMQSGLFGAPPEIWWRVEVSEVFEVGFLGVIGMAAWRGHPAEMEDRDSHHSETAH